MALADFMTVIPDFILLLTRAGANFAFANDYISMIMEIKRLVPRGDILGFVENSY